MATHQQMLETIEYLEKLVKRKYPITDKTTDKSELWKTRRHKLNQLWNFSVLINEDI